LTNNYLKSDSAGTIVQGIQSVLDELSVIKKSLSIDQAGPLGIKEAARYLKMSTQSIYKEAEKGSIPHYQESRGSRIFFYKEELDSWVKSKKRISKKEILEDADNLKIGGHGN
jgi:excisionase family DNA binding protein